MSSNEKTCGQAATPFRSTVPADEPTASILMHARNEPDEPLPVVSPEGGRFLGLMDLSTLAEECRGAGHLPAQCAARNHLRLGVGTRFADELVDRGGAAPAAAQSEHDGSREGRPLIVVVSREGAPVGYLRPRDPEDDRRS
jgi:hypothetical protein